MSIDKIHVELTRDDWIALLVAAFYGANDLENEDYPHAAGVADRLVEQLTTAMGIHDLDDEITALESRLEGNHQ